MAAYFEDELSLAPIRDPRRILELGWVRLLSHHSTVMFMLGVEQAVELGGTFFARVPVLLIPVNRAIQAAKKYPDAEVTAVDLVPLPPR
jgi:hypothetical protein